LKDFRRLPGAAFQLDTLRTVTQLPLRAAINTHWHFDHTLEIRSMAARNPHLGARRCGVADDAVYPKWQAEDLATFLAPWEKRVSDAKTDSQREHAKSDIEA